jgi:hypothetical protein
MSQTGHISKLYLFAKDTDATDIIRGFKYQELKTLEIWLYNRVNGIDENIYCDYEEDIFQRDLSDFKTTFKQIKLYSSRHFSFSSPELIKAINHFFMLFVKGDYLFDEPLFIFETNTSYAYQRGDKYESLLEEWVENQENLSEELLDRCSQKVRAIVEQNIKSQSENLPSKKDSPEIVQAIQILEELPGETWKKFVMSIRWIFKGISTDEAIAQSIKYSVELINQLPFPIVSDEHLLVLDRLRGIISDKSMTLDPQGRMLTTELLNHALLNLGSKEDKNYLKTYEIWKDVSDLEYFKIGEFYQVLFSAKYCRRNTYLEDHSSQWLNLLDKFIAITIPLPKYRRQAIYEFIWQVLRPSVDRLPDTSLEGFEGLVLDYFSDFENYDDINSIEDTHNLLTVVATSQRLGLIKIDENEVLSWFVRFDKFMAKSKELAADKNIYCSLLEIEGFSFFNKSTLGIGEDSNANAFKRFEEIIIELPEAQTYAVSHFGKRLDAIIDLVIKVGYDKDIESLESFTEKLIPFIQEREGNFSLARGCIDRGMKYLNSRNPKGLLKAINKFHSAKELYYDEATFEGFVLALLAISQLYASVGMNIASKYYSLSAIWFCSENRDPKLYKRISDSYGILFHADFKQGSWISALSDFEDYIGIRTELDPAEFNPYTDEILKKSIVEESFILGLMPLISNQLSGFVNYEKTKMGELYTDFLKDSVEYSASLVPEIGLQELLSRKLNSPPIDDIGEIRVISWKTFGCLWNVEFANDFVTNSIAEEFVALIQIIQSDIALNEIDFHLTKGIIRLRIEIVTSLKSPEQLPSKDEYLWKVFLPLLESKEASDKNMHYGAITASFKIILNEISLLEDEVFQERFEGLFKKGLGNKAFIINSYQREYRMVFSEERFLASLRNKFKSEFAPIEYYESASLSSNINESEFYNYEQSIKNIRSRYKNSLRAIHFTLKRLKLSEEFNEKVAKFREDGWLDWQILLALFNTVIDLKAKNILVQNGKKYSSDSEWLEDLQKTLETIMNLDEKETYIEIPLDIIYGENFDRQMYLLPIHVLRSFKLESKSRFPNPNALRLFLNEKFRFDTNDVKELSPFGI